MKELKSKTMKALLAQGIRRAKKTKTPFDGHMTGLVYKTLRNGWHYQVEYVNDTRLMPKPYVVVYAFAPPADFSCRSADFYLTQVM